MSYTHSIEAPLSERLRFSPQCVQSDELLDALKELEELRDKVEEMEEEREEARKKSADRDALYSFFEDVTTAMDEEAGYWPCKEPHDPALLEAVIERLRAGCRAELEAEES